MIDLAVFVRLGNATSRDSNGILRDADQAIGIGHREFTFVRRGRLQSENAAREHVGSLVDISLLVPPDLSHL